MKKFVFIIGEVVILINKDTKILAIEKFSKEYKILFGQNWNVMQVNDEI